MTKTDDIAAIRAKLSELLEQVDADDQTIAILEANLTLSVDQTKALINEGRASLVKLADLEAICAKLVHAQASMRTAIVVLNDFLDRLFPSPNTAAKGSA